MATPRRKPTTGRSAPAKRTTAARKPAPKKAPTKRTSAGTGEGLAVIGSTRKSLEPGETGKKAGFTAQMRAAEKRVAPKATKEKDPGAFTTITDSLHAAYSGSRVHVLDVPYEERALASACGADWVDTIRKYVSVGPIIPEALRKYRSLDYSMSRWLEDQINRAYTATEPPHGPLFSLRPHQQDGVNAINTAGKAGWRGFIIADGTGLGKSLTGLVGASAIATQRGFTEKKKAKLLVIVPKAAIPHWRNTFRQSGVKNLRPLIINYDQYKALLIVPKEAKAAKKTRTKNKQIAAKGKSFIQWDLIIADESHKMKNAAAQRTQAFETIAAYSQASKNNPPFVIWMSATMGQNPLDVCYVAPLIGQATKLPYLTIGRWGDWLAEKGFNVKENKGGWTWVKAPLSASPEEKERVREIQKADVTRLAKMLFGPNAPSIRRMPEDLAGWPKLQRIPTPVDLSVPKQLMYQAAWTQFRKDMLLVQSGKDPQGALAAILRFRQKASLLKTEDTTDLIVDLLENGHQVAVSFQFIEPLREVKKALAKRGVLAVEYSGEVAADQEKNRIAFQKGQAPVILFTVVEAVSFHAEEQLPDGTKATRTRRATVIHDVRFSAIDNTQLTGRTHRDSQKANAYFTYAEGTIEEQILNSMLTKMANMAILSGDDADTVEEIENLLISQVLTS